MHRNGFEPVNPVASKSNAHQSVRMPRSYFGGSVRAVKTDVDVASSRCCETMPPPRRKTGYADDVEGLKGVNAYSH